MKKIFIFSILAFIGFSSKSQNFIRVTRTNQEQTISLSTDQVLEIQLPKKPSNGYTWVEATSSDEKKVNKSISQIGDGDFIYDPVTASPTNPKGRMAGGSGTQLIRYVGTSQGTTLLTLELRRPWLKDSKAIDSYTITIVSAGKYSGTYTPPLKAIRKLDQPMTSPLTQIPGIPTAWDWRSQCTPIENQVACGDCWAYASVGTLECNILIHDGVTRDISEEFVTDCYTGNGCNGCNGGNCAHQAWLASFTGANSSGGGAVYETEDPTTCNNTGVTGKCKAPYVPHETIDSYHDLGGRNSYGVPPVDSIKKAIYNYGPVWACIDASSSAWDNYSHGIMVESGTTIDHAIMLVGWKDTTVSDNSGGYWILRNSWGTGWGVNGSGYMYVSYGSDAVGCDADYIVYKGGVSHGVAPTAVFSYSPASPFAGQSISFTDNSIGNPTSWYWSFGDGDTSIIQNPVHIYTAAGTYTVSLKVSNALGNNMATNSIIVKAPTAAFSFSPSSPLTGQTVQFTDNSTGSPTQWNWNFGDTTNSIIVQSALQNPSHIYKTSGTYTITLTAINTYGNYSITNSITVAATPTVTASALQTTICSGDTVHLTSTVTGGTTFTYSWASLPTGFTSTLQNPKVVPTINTTYSVTVTSNGYTASSSVAVTVNPSPVATISSSNVSCNGSNNGSATVTVTGGTPSYAYLWSNNATSPTINNLAAGAYYVTVTDYNGCKKVTTVTITQPTALAARISSQINVITNGGNNGSAIVSVSGGTSPYTYSWNTTPVQTTLSATGLSVGIYTVTVTDANSCTKTASVNIILQTSSQNTCANSDFSTGDFTDWTGSIGKNNTGSAGADYVVEVNNIVAGALNAAPHTEGQQTIMNVAGTDINTGNMLSVIPPGGTSSCRLGNEMVEDDDATYKTYPQAAQLIYTTRITPINTIFTCKYAVVLQNPASSHTVVQMPKFKIYFSDSIGKGIDTVCSMYTVVAEPGIPGFNACMPDPGCATPTDSVLWCNWRSYSVDLSSYIGHIINVKFTSYDCTLGAHFGYAYISCSCSNLQITQSCAGTSDILSAPPGFTAYSWSPATGLSATTGQTVALANAGNYNGNIYTCLCTPVTGNTCLFTVKAIVNFSPLVVTTTSDTICEGQTATLTANGGVGSTYQWSNGGNTDTINPVPGATTTYTVTATNGNCSNTATAIVTVNQNPVPVITGPSSICVGNTATLDAGAGYSSYLWSNNATTETIPVTTPGTYSVTVSNASGCTGTTSTVVTVNPNLTPAITGPSSICSGNTATLDAGAGYTSYLWSNNATTETIPVTTAGTYTVTVSNSAGCSGTASTVVTVNQNPVPVITGPSSICVGNTATLDAGAGYSSYLWSNSATTETILVTTAETYSVTVSNASGCTGTTSTVVTVNPNLTPAITGPSSICSGNTATLDAGAGSTSYLWSNNATTETIPVTTAGTYTVTVSNSLGCSGTASTVVTVNQNPTPIITGTTAICAGNTATLDAGVGYASYLWSNSATNETVSISTAGTYTVTVSNSSGCIGTSSFSVNIIPIPVSQFTLIVNTNTVNFATTYNASNIYFWNFGDGTISNQSNPVHTFTNTGYFNACLNVTDTVTGCQSNYCSDILIGSSSTACLAKFGYSLSGNTVTFTDSSLGNPNNWYWQFGDATTSTLQNPVHTYTNNGLYNISLTISNSATDCSNIISKQLNVNNINDCVSGFSFYSDVASNTVTFTDQSLGDITSYLWSFGDDSSSILQNPVHTYQQAGYYNVCHTVFNTSTACYNILCNDVTVGNSSSLCKANFIFTLDTVTRTVQFSDCSFGSPDEWTWNFGDNTYAYVQNPSHTYGTNGIYSIQLNILNDITNCSDFIVQLVNVNSTQSLDCEFGYNNNLISTLHKGSKPEYPVAFVAAVFGTPEKYVWSFGDKGKDSSTTTPTHYYDSLGTYNVCLFVENNTINESKTYCKQVEVNNIITNANDYLQLNSLNIFPNPANDNITIINSNFINDQKLSIYNIQGQLLIQQPMLQARTNINISALPVGMYYIEINTNNGVAVKVFVKD